MTDPTPMLAGAGAVGTIGQMVGLTWPPPSIAVFWVSICLVLAGLLGELVYRFARLPRLVGYVVTGLVAGALGLGAVDNVLPDSARIVLDLALALLLFEAGNRISLRWLRENPWLLAYCLCEATLTFLAVLALLDWLGVDITVALPLAAIAIATSPAVLMRIASEFRAAGQVTERMMVMAGLNTCLAVLASQMVNGWLVHESGVGLAGAIALPVYQLLGSALIAALLAGVVLVLSRYVDLRNDYASILLVGVILFGLSLAGIARQSTLLVPLLAGLMLKNFRDRPGTWPRQFGTAGNVLVLMLFVTTGAAWSPATVVGGGVLALSIVAVRLLTKSATAIAFSRASGISLRQGVALGLTGIPMSAPALALLADLHKMSPAHALPVAPIVLSAVLALELIGPLIVHAALRWAGEEHAT